MGIQEILNCNKTIAEFIGYVPTEKETGEPTFTHENMPKGSVIWLGQFNYFKSWDSLMLVVEKIESMGYESKMLFGTGREKYPMVDYFFGFMPFKIGSYVSHSSSRTSKIEATYNAVVDFIKWYNQNNNQ